MNPTGPVPAAVHDIRATGSLRDHAAPLHRDGRRRCDRRRPMHPPR